MSIKLVDGLVFGLMTVLDSFSLYRAVSQRAEEKREKWQIPEKNVHMLDTRSYKISGVIRPPD